MITSIIFDFAGVIGSEGYWLWLAEAVSDLKEREAFFHQITREVDSGRIEHDEFAKKLSSAIGCPASSVWPEIKKRTKINRELLEFITQLQKGGYKLGLLTNYTHPWFLELMEEYRLGPYFDAVLISSQHRMIKPDAEIYHTMLTFLGVEPAHGVFIDDRARNVQGAIDVGLSGLIYTTNTKLIGDLKALGISPS